MSEGYAVQQERDVLPGPKLAAVGVASLLVAVLAVAVSGAMVASDQERIGGGVALRAIQSGPTAPEAIGLIGQTLIEHEETGLALRRAQRVRLESLGWVDRSAGIAHIPIDRAMDLTLRAGDADGGRP